MKYRRPKNTFQFEEDPFANKTEGISKICHEALLLLNFLQTKPQLKSMNINFFNLYFTNIKNRDDREEQELDNYDILYDNKFMPIYDTGTKARETLLR